MRHQSKISPPPEAGAKANSTSQKSQVSFTMPVKAFDNYLNNPKPHYHGIARSRH
ncbi:MAG: hypothetical protein HOP23_13030 [Methylococcaceae bacterium]|nr:hypothetical protein [Methylococcaceae bacterium]